MCADVHCGNVLCESVFVSVFEKYWSMLEYVSTEYFMTFFRISIYNADQTGNIFKSCRVLYFYKSIFLFPCMSLT